MVKGCQRRIIQIKDTGSDMFTEAYFVLSDAACHREETDIVKEATRLIEEGTEACPRPLKQPFSLLVGFLLGVASCAGGVLLLLLLS